MEMQRRQTEAKLYNEDELWYICHSVTAACGHLQQFRLHHGHICPMQIIITDDGQIKIADYGLLTQGKTGYAHVFLHEGPAFLAPSQMQDLAAMKDKQSGIPWKTDVFALGMVLLNAATLTDGQFLTDCYNFGRRVMNGDKISNKIKLAERRYSQKFMGVLRAMLVPDDDKRYDFFTLMNVLQELGVAADLPHKQLNWDTPHLSNSPLKSVDRFGPTPRLDGPRTVTFAKDGKGLSSEDPQRIGSPMMMEFHYYWLDKRENGMLQRYKAYLIDLQRRIDNGEYVSGAEKDERRRLAEIEKTGKAPFHHEDDEFHRLKLHLDLYA
jgi:serine/threonine protein kinase